MSKLKARQKAARLKDRKLRAQQSLALKVEKEKAAQLEKAQQDIKRNKTESVIRSANSLKQEAKSKIKLSDPNAQKAFNEICKSIGENHRVAFDFVIEEVEAATKGSDYAVKFAKQSGISKEDCEGAIKRHLSDVEDGPQAIILSCTAPYFINGDIDGGVKFRTSIVDAVMKKYQIGKYSSQSIIKDTNTAIARLFDEYLESIAKPKKTSSCDLSKSFLSVVGVIKKPSPSLQQHIIAMEIILGVGHEFKAAKIPIDDLKNIFTDLGYVCVTPVSNFSQSVKAMLNRGTKQKELEQAIDLFREINPMGNYDSIERYINCAPVICNAMTLLYSELVDEHQVSSEITNFMRDSSMVEGSISGRPGFDLFSWVVTI